jgi:c-di-GMP-binding flagellar brake protein YcgR
MFTSTIARWKKLVGWRQTQEPLKEDRRVWSRHSCTIEATYQVAGGTATEHLRATVRDVSRGGIGLLTDRRLEPGGLLSLQLPTDPGEPMSTVLACVVRCKEGPTGEWFLGCTFAAELGDCDLQLFGARDKAKHPEQRGQSRFPCRARASFRLVKPADAPAVPAKILNLSVGGVALCVADPPALGELVNVELRAGEDFLFNTLACVVRLTIPADGQQPVLGCNFISELAEAQLKALV